MAESTNETELTQSFEQEEIDKEDENKPKILNSAEILQQHIETVDEEILAHEDIGNWCDVLENDLPTLENGAADDKPSDGVEQPPLPTVPKAYPHRVSLVLGNDLTICQLPDKGPFYLLAYSLPDDVSEEELYMLFGGKRSIESRTYRRDLREIMFNFKKREHLIDALLKQDMTFKEKPLRMALVLHAHQIHHFHQHNAEHVNYDLFMLPFKGAFDKCHERLEDGSWSELFDDMIDVDDNSSNSQIQSYQKSNSNDVRLSLQQNSFPDNRQRAGSITSMTSAKSYTGQPPSQNVSRQSSYQPSDREPRPAVFQTQQSVERQHRPPSPSTNQKRLDTTKSQPRSNPFGDAKPVDTNDKVLTMIAQQSMEQQKKAASVSQDCNKPPPPIIHPFPNNDMVPGMVKIQKRPLGIPAHTGSMQWVNSNYKRPASSHQQHSQNHVMEVAEIDVSKPPPAIPADRKQRNRKTFRQNGFVPYNVKHNPGKTYNNTSHQSMPPASFKDGSRRKSSIDQSAVQDKIETEKSQSAPLSHETIALSQNSPRSSPSCNSLKRPNSANSSMSFVTAHSGSEISSTMSTDLPCVPSLTDSINERMCDIGGEHRRHSWEGQNSPGPQKDKTTKKNSAGLKRGNKSSGSDELKRSISRQSSTSTPQYQSASNVFLDVSEGSEATEKASIESQPDPEHMVLSKTKNALENRAPSLPISRPHTSSNEKTTNAPKQEPNKPDSISAPPTPSGLNKKKLDKSKKDKKKPNVLQNNKFSVLENSPLT